MGKILVTVKDIHGRKGIGGIEHYYKALRPHFGQEVLYYTIGKRDHSRGRWDDIKQGLSDWKRFWNLLRGESVELVNLNPSLTRNCLLRDGVFLLLAKLRGKKAVVFIRGWNEQIAARIDGRWQPLFRAVFGRADEMIVLSAHFKNKLREWGYRGPICLESTTVDDRLLEGGTQTTKPGATVNVLFLARVERAKGVYEAIDAHQILRQKHDVRLTIVGDGTELPAVRRYVEERKIAGVDFAGYVEGSQKAEAFRKADVYIFPSTHGEGMPNSVLEAMAFGLPVVTTSAGGLVEFFEDGKMGFLMTELSPEVVADRLSTLIENAALRQEIGERNAAYAQEHFLASKVAARLGGIWRGVSRSKAGEAKLMGEKSWRPALDGVEV